MKERECMFILNLGKLEDNSDREGQVLCNMWNLKSQTCFKKEENGGY